jgi:hypothetical protein
MTDSWAGIAAVWAYKDGRLYWRVQAGRGISVRYPGDEVNPVPDNHGYQFVTWRRKHYAVHRVVFLLVNGWLPDCVDHIDGNPLNNLAENLRPATRLQNQYNRRINRRSKSGVKNVTPHQGRWCVRFSVNRRTKHFGCFDTLDQAAEAAARVRAELHGEFARHA